MIYAQRHECKLCRALLREWENKRAACIDAMTCYPDLQIDKDTDAGTIATKAEHTVKHHIFLEDCARQRVRGLIKIRCPNCRQKD